MCGINGIVNNLDKESKIKIMQKMSEASASRGPDGSDTFIDEHCCLNHRLLAITDSPNVSSQPWGENRKLVYNGEIYNTNDLKNSLSRNCWNWKTDSDTEVLYHGLCEHGIDFVKQINGMYAFAWYDYPNVFLVRDYGGIKPLYYSKQLGGLTFSSSIKSLIQAGVSTELNLDTVEYYFNLGYCPGRQTLFKNIQKVGANEVLIYNIEQKSFSSQFFKEDIVEQRNFDADEFRKALSKTVESTLVGRRSIGLFLSGGVDSSSILHEACKYKDNLDTFTTKFEVSSKDHKCNEDARCAKMLAQQYKTNHHELLITCDDFIDSIPNCVDALEEVRYNRSSPAYYLMNKYISEQGIIVTLSGDGGDEIFTGYPRHLDISTGNFDDWFQLTRFAQTFGNNNTVKKSLKKCLSYIKNPVEKDEVNKFLFWECQNHLPEDFLIRNDKLGMHFGMEARFPFTNREFRNYVLGIPSKYKTNKKIMFESYNKILPDFIINKQKTGWAIPVDWYKQIKQSGYYNHILNKTKRLDEIIENQNQNKNKNKKFWSELYFRCWAYNFKVSI